MKAEVQNHNNMPTQLELITKILEQFPAEWNITQDSFNLCIAFVDEMIADNQKEIPS